MAATLRAARPECRRAATGVGRAGFGDGFARAQPTPVDWCRVKHAVDWYQTGTLLKIGARSIAGRRRARIAYTSVYPLQAVFAHVLAASRAPLARPTFGGVARTRSTAARVGPASGRPSIASAELGRRGSRRRGASPRGGNRTSTAVHDGSPTPPHAITPGVAERRWLGGDLEASSLCA